MSIDETFNSYINRTDMCFRTPATREQITEFEKQNNICLPTAYKEWLQLTDGGELYLPAGLQLYGVAPEHKPLIDVNDDCRPNDNYIVIGALASGDPILCEKDSERISIYNAEAGKIEDDESFADFCVFIQSLSEIVYTGE